MQQIRTHIVLRDLVHFELAIFRLGFELFKFVVYGATCFKNLDEQGHGDTTALYVMFDLPKMLCLVALVVKFAYNIYITVKKRAEKKRQGLVCGGSSFLTTSRQQLR